MKVLIRGGRVVDPSQKLSEARDVLIDNGRIKSLSKPGSRADGAKVVDAKGMIVCPGLIDMHTHLREPGFEYKETVLSGAQAAVAGGFSALACMPNTKPVNDGAAVTDFILERAEEAGLAKVYPVGAISSGLNGEGLAELGELKDHGCVAVSDDGNPVMNSELMRRALEYCRGLDMPVISHSEDLHLTGRGVMHFGRISTELGLEGIPAAAEETMVARDIILAEMTGSRLHLAHLSTAGSVRLLREAKKRGAPVTGECTPHHFTLSDEAVRGYNTSTKMKPPLRAETDRQALIEALADGTIDAIASDHAPHSSVEKDVEFDIAMFGIIGLETSLPLALHLVHEKKITIERMIELMSVNPARILGLSGGTLREGCPADVTIIDPDSEWTVDATLFHSKSRNTPFNGLRVKGKAVQVIVDGRVLKLPRLKKSRHTLELFPDLD